MTPRPTRVQLFATCLVDRFFPAAGHAAVEVLERCGLEVTVPPDQTCCGQPAFNGGFARDAAAMARATIDVLSRSEDPVVVPSGSCAEMIINQYPQLLADDEVYASKAKALAARTFEFSQFLVDVVGVELPAAGTGTRVAYHASCHGLRGLGLHDQPRRLLRAVAGDGCADLPDAETCCGFGGLFCVKYPEISGKMVDAKVDDVLATGADTLLGGDLGCLLNISGRLHRRSANVRVRHVAEVLADATADAPAIGEGK
jgi:L-lactate dehydrogenase complex protein LldE